MGSLSRRKGFTFERYVATAYRLRWPEVTVRRGRQSDRPWESDVVVEGDVVLGRLWTECQHARGADPQAKLRQAERDVGVLVARSLCETFHRMPVVVWREHGSSLVHATTRLWVLLELSTGSWSPDARGAFGVVTTSFSSFLDVASRSTVLDGDQVGR